MMPWLRHCKIREELIHLKRNFTKYPLFRKVNKIDQTFVVVLMKFSFITIDS